MKRKLGKSGIEVFSIGLGAMPLSIQGRPSEEEGVKVIHAALEAGVNFIDTANVYCLDQSDIGHNERLISKAIATYLNEKKLMIVATKGGLARPQGDWVSDASPSALKKACEQSLRDLKTDSLFLYQLHAPDADVPLEDSVGELAKLKDQGKIQHIGLSNVSKTELIRALSIVRIETVQNRCHIYHHPDLLNGMVSFCEENEITFLPYSPVGGGHGHFKLAQDPLLNQLAEKYSTSPYCIALKWLLDKSDWILPIPGASRVSSIQDSVRAVKVSLSAEDSLKLDQIQAFH
jgi:aryl-alcohol dehydrogenase-like predicted oxidoreductase